MNLVEEIPGLREAIERETESREFDFLGAPELLCGIEVMPLSIRRLLRLHAVQSPFLYATLNGIEQTPEAPADVALFFWSLSPNYERALAVRLWCECASIGLGQIMFSQIRLRFVRRLRTIKPADACKACRGYVAAAFEDAPGGDGNAPSINYYGWPASYVGLLASEYGWSEDAVLDMPLRRLWQHVRRLILKNNPNATLFNPSDKIRGKWLAEINKAENQN